MATASMPGFSVNLGRFDRSLRVALGIVILVLGLLFQSWWGLLGVIPLVTGLTSFCPLYRLFRIHTRG